MPNFKFHENPPIGSRVVHADGESYINRQTRREREAESETDVTQLRVATSKFSERTYKSKYDA